MKTIKLSQTSPDVARLFDHARDDDVIVRLADGSEFLCHRRRFRPRDREDPCQREADGPAGGSRRADDDRPARRGQAQLRPLNERPFDRGSPTMSIKLRDKETDLPPLADEPAALGELTRSSRSTSARAARSLPEDGRRPQGPAHQVPRGEPDAVSPFFKHDYGAERIDGLIKGVCAVLGIGYKATASTLFRKPGMKHGIEADKSYYIEHATALRTTRDGAPRSAASWACRRSGCTGCGSFARQFLHLGLTAGIDPRPRAAPSRSSPRPTWCRGSRTYPCEHGHRVLRVSRLWKVGSTKEFGTRGDGPEPRFSRWFLRPDRAVGGPSVTEFRAGASRRDHGPPAGKRAMPSIVVRCRGRSRRGR